MSHTPPPGVLVPQDKEPDSPRESQMQHQARVLENSLRQYAGKLGLKIRVMYDPYHWGFKIYAAVMSSNELCTIDEEILTVRQPAGSTAVADLLQRTLEDLQLKLHDNMAAAMQRTDVRDRQYVLSKADKETLHRMYMDALNECHRDYNRSEEGCKKADKYQELMSRLFR